jgi:NAD(P)-dependent dehydrogenase (short-subunit alcohol dehydrogenase family)
MDFGLKGKHALVAGGGRGIGKAIARELAREGADVVIASRTMEQLEKSAKEIEDETGQRVIPLGVDVTKRGEVDRVVAEAADRMGGLHILVNSASLPGGSASAVGAIETVDEDALLSDFDVKYVGALRCPGLNPFLEATRLGPHHQHQWYQCPQCR